MGAKGVLQNTDQGSLELGNQPVSQTQRVEEARNKPESVYAFYKLAFTTDKDAPAVILRASAKKEPSSRTVDDYLIYPVVALRCRQYIGDAFGFNAFDPNDAVVSLPQYNKLVKDGASALNPTARKGVQSVIPGTRHGVSYGIVFNGEIYQPSVTGAGGNSPVKGGVVRVMVPSIVRAYHFINAIRNPANVSTSAKAAIVGIVTPGGKRIMFGEKLVEQVDG